MMRDEKTPPVELSARTKEFALRVIRLFCSLPKNTQAQVLGKQALRSGTSVGANYREAKRSRSRAEFISIIGVCIKELNETAYWLELLVESDIVSSQKLKDLYQECDQLIAILTTISKKTKASALHTSSLNTPSPIKAG
jgi:four helix bundle protein